MIDYEKLGVFYLGRRHDLATGKTTDAPLLYDAKDLTTHAVCVGMTGSGKTGLGVSLIEEAAIDGVPALVIDPKGDLGNLLLTFPELRAEDFRPWVDPAEARRLQLTEDALAAREAEKWRTGLAAWGQSGDRIRRLREAADLAIYTPGSDSGLPVSILGSFAAPVAAVRSDGDLMRERVATAATGLLSLMGIDADPLRSREHVLLANLFDDAWRKGADLDLPALIRAIQSPPFARVGVLDLEAFYPEKDRFELSMRLNNLVAAPSFRAWTSGDALDIQSLLYTAEGRPRVAILSIAHLPESVRMFFVALLLNEVVGWMRARSGTTSLRALLYMDEVFGFLPPTAEPPSKRPFLTLLKQARAYGLGVVLATQNPVDLDYKSLSNSGTWFLGRLQTERDKLRVIEGLEGAAAGVPFDRAAMERTLAGLGSRVFLMHNVHEDGPVVFETRWTLSYLRGPLTRDQIAGLARERKVEAPAGATAPLSPVAAASSPASAEARPVLAPSIPEAFLPLRQTCDAGALVYRPLLLGLARVQYVDRKTRRLKHAQETALAVALDDSAGPPEWQAGEAVDFCAEDLETTAAGPARYLPVQAAGAKASSYTSWRKQLTDLLFRTRTLDLLESASVGLVSEPGESERDFRARLTDLAREKRDRQVDTLRKGYARRITSLEERIRKASAAVDRERSQASGQKLQTAISFGATILSALVGNKKMSYGTLGRATTAVRGVGRAAKETQDVQRAAENLEALQAQLAELNSELESEIGQLEERTNPLTEKLGVETLRPRRSDVEVRRVTLAWAPQAADAGGTLRELWR